MINNRIPLITPQGRAKRVEQGRDYIVGLCPGCAVLVLVVDSKGEMILSRNVGPGSAAEILHMAAEQARPTTVPVKGP